MVWHHCGAGTQTIRVQLETGRTVGVPRTEPAHLDYGYAGTSHALQSRTTDRVIVVVDTARAAEAIVNRRLAYVASSRMRDDLQLYTDDGARLSFALGRDVSHRSAIEDPPARPRGQTYTAQVEHARSV
jgi:ATP-dependent exoDNAse (exonuclease V) alpha subunit